MSDERVLNILLKALNITKFNDLILSFTDFECYRMIYRVGQTKRGRAFQLVTSEVLLGSSLFLAENKVICPLNS